MPTYTLKDNVTGRTLTVDLPKQPTPAEMAELFAKNAPTEEEWDPWKPISKIPSFGERAWEVAKTPLLAGLEAIGRPGEFISGTVAGALSPEHDLTRGLRAFTEPLIGGKQEEHFAKVIEEQAPEFAKAHPWATAGLGFVADISTDPWNLLGKAGMLRRPLVAGLEKAGLSASTANKVALVDNPLRRLHEEQVVPALKKVGLEIQTLPGVKSMFPDAELKKLVGKSGITAEEMRYIANLRGKVKQQQYNELIDRWATSHNLTAQEANTIPEAIREPGGDAWKTLQTRIAAETARGEDRLQQAVDNFKYINTQLRAEELTSKLQKAMGVPKRVDAPILQAANSLSPTEQNLLKQAFTQPQMVDKYGRVSQVELRKFLTANNAQDRTKAIAKSLVQQLQPEVTSMSGTKLELPVVKFETIDFDPKKGLVFSTERPNYVPQGAVKTPTNQFQGPGGMTQAFHELNASLGAAKEQVLPWAEYVRRGGATNAVDILKARASQSIRAATNLNVMSQWADNFGSAFNPGGNYAQLAADTVDYLPEAVRAKFAGQWFPKPIVDQIERVSQKLNDPVEMESMWRRGMKLWKAYRTSANLPSFQSGNFVGNIGAVHAATDFGIDQILKDVAKATQVVTGHGEFAPITVGGQTLKNDDVLKLAEYFGLGTRAGKVFERPKAATRIGSLQEEYIKGRPMTERAKAIFGQKGNIMAALNPENAAFQKLHQLNQDYIEDPAKLALFYRELASGKTPKQAILSVRKVLIDYSDLTDFERKYVSDFIPFYTWTRKMMPAMMASFLERPIKVAQQSRIFDMLRDFDKDASESFDPEELPHLAAPNVFPFPGLRGKEDQPVFGKMSLPLFELQKLTADPEQFVREAGFMINPVPRMAYEKFILNHPLGLPAYVSLTDPDVPAGTVGRLAGSAGLGSLVGAWKDPRTEEWRQSAQSRWFTNEIPIPMAAAARTLTPGGATSPQINPFLEFLLRSLNLSPIGLSETAQAAGRRELSRKENE